MSNEVTVKTYDLNYGFDLNHPYYRFTRAIDVPANTLTTVTTVPAVPVSVEFPSNLHSKALDGAVPQSNTLHSKSLHNDGYRWYGNHCSWHPKGLNYWY